MIALVVGFGALFVLTGEETPPNPAERAMLVDIAALGGDFEIDPSRERALKTTYFDKSWELTYEYDDPREGAPYLDCTVTFERKRSDTLTSYTALWASARLGIQAFGEGDVDLVEPDDGYEWGEASKFAILTTEGAPAGNVFIARKGTAIFFLIVAGWYYEDPADFGAMIEPYLERMAHHPH